MRPTWSVLVISGSLTAAALIACGSDDSSPGASRDAGSGSDGTLPLRDAATTLDAADASATTNPADADAAAGGGAGSVAACLTGSTSDAGETAACTTLAQCAQSSCNSPFASAFGADWANGTVSGACAGFYQCVQAAGCGPSAITSCESSIALSCAGALLTVESCLQDSCASEESACNASIGSVIPTDASTDAD